VFSEGMPDMKALFEQASAMQQRMVDAQAELAEARVTGSSGGGLVTATVDGTGELLSLDISPDVCDPSETETLSDLVVAAIRDASAKANEHAANQLEDLSGGLGFGAQDLGGSRLLGRSGGLLGAGGVSGGPDAAPQRGAGESDSDSPPWGFGHPPD
jgi:nucleoid-associated protein EbfC